MVKEDKSWKWQSEEINFEYWLKCCWRHNARVKEESKRNNRTGWVVFWEFVSWNWCQADWKAVEFDSEKKHLLDEMRKGVTTNDQIGGVKLHWYSYQLSWKPTSDWHIPYKLTFGLLSVFQFCQSIWQRCSPEFQRTADSWQLHSSLPSASFRAQGMLWWRLEDLQG